MKRSAQLRLILDAHASIAFLAGSVLDLKSGIDVRLVQKGRVGSRIWRADDGAGGPALNAAVETIGSGSDIAVLLNVTHLVEPQARAYIRATLPAVGTIMSFTPPEGSTPRAVAGGAHAASIADQVTSAVRGSRIDPDNMVHIFAACPNSLLFYLGQQHQGVAPCIVYEFDFDRRGFKGYQPSFIMD